MGRHISGALNPAIYDAPPLAQNSPVTVNPTSVTILRSGPTTVTLTMTGSGTHTVRPLTSLPGVSITPATREISANLPGTFTITRNEGAQAGSVLFASTTLSGFAVLQVAMGVEKLGEQALNGSSFINLPANTVRVEVTARGGPGTATYTYRKFVEGVQEVWSYKLAFVPDTSGKWDEWFTGFGHTAPYGKSYPRGGEASTKNEQSTPDFLGQEAYYTDRIYYWDQSELVGDILKAVGMIWRRYMFIAQSVRDRLITPGQAGYYTNVTVPGETGKVFEAEYVGDRQFWPGSPADTTTPPSPETRVWNVQAGTARQLKWVQNTGTVGNAIWYG